MAAMVTTSIMVVMGATTLVIAHERAPPAFTMIDVAETVGLKGINASRVAVADLDGDGRPDLIIDRTNVWLNRAAAGLRFEQADMTLESPGPDGVSIFVDLDGDRIPDAVVARSRGATLWQRGRGDGRFDAAQSIEAARLGTVASIAAGDVDRDGRTDLFIGRWYRAYGESPEAFPADLLLNRRDDNGQVRFERAALPEDDVAFDEERDAGARPLYGTMIATLLDPERFTPPQLVGLAYGRRWNRLYARERGGSGEWHDQAPALGFDGDADRSGVYPEWLRERAKVDPRFDRKTEKPFRANGNTFDMSVGDVDGDGRFDAVVAEITHAWAGPSSDRSRVLLQNERVFASSAAFSLDRIPAPNADDAQKWNQGDLFVELGDLDLDGRLDVVLASGDYPDPPPLDERLRVFLQGAEAVGREQRLTDATAALGIDHPGCGQIALADFDLDGRVDIVAGQSFTRFTPEMVAAAGGTPRVRLLLNRTGAQSTEAPRALSLELVGDPSRGIAAVPFGAIIEVRTNDANGMERVQRRQLVGPGGHSGKQSEAMVHIGLGTAREAQVRVIWPSEPPLVSDWRTLPTGRHRLSP